MIWELYEIVVNASFAKDAFNLSDTISDLICDTTGGLVSYFGLKELLKTQKIVYNLNMEIVENKNKK